MAGSDPTILRALIDRLARLVQAEDWDRDLNPAQMTALSYLSRANRFSRAPANVADYMGATRGTVSQTLLALERKGFLESQASATDRRSLTYRLTPMGQARIQDRSAFDAALDALPDAQATALGGALDMLLKELLLQRGGRSFGACRTCRHHTAREEGAGWCNLLHLPLSAQDGGELCHEHTPRPMERT
jgi:DNA-binding MarR family transcriptional regulator